MPRSFNLFTASPSFLLAATNSSPSWFKQRRSLVRQLSKSVNRILGILKLLSFDFAFINYAISTVSSISTEAFKGSTAIPTAERACLPFSPKISNNNSLAPFTTAGC